MNTELEKTPSGERSEIDHFPIIGIIGPIASGKDTISKILNENFGIAQFTISDNLKRLALSRGIQPPYARDLLWDISLKVLNDMGPGGNTAMTEIIIEARRRLLKIQGATIDGIRHLSDAQKLKSLPNSLLIAVNAPQTTRFERSVHREREEDSTDFYEFLERDKLENSTIAPLYELADITINNSGTIEDLEAQVMEFFIEKTDVF